VSNRKDIFRLKLAIEACNKIGHGTRTLGLRVCSWIYNHPQHRFMADEPFPLPWTKCDELLKGACERQTYNMLRELVSAGHFAYHGALGCPAKAHFRLIIPDLSATDRAAKNCCPSTAKNCRPRTAKNSRPRAAMKRSPLISNSFQEEIVNQMEENNSALRATRNEGGAQQPPAADNVGDAQRSALKDLRNKLKKGLA
jgi:hypothetical protein